MRTQRRTDGHTDDTWTNLDRLLAHFDRIWHVRDGLTKTRKYKQPGRQADRRAGGRTDKQADTCTDERMEDGQEDRDMDATTDG